FSKNSKRLSTHWNSRSYGDSPGHDLMSRTSPVSRPSICRPRKRPSADWSRLKRTARLVPSGKCISDAAAPPRWLQTVPRPRRRESSAQKHQKREIRKRRIHRTSFNPWINSALSANRTHVVTARGLELGCLPHAAFVDPPCHSIPTFFASASRANCTPCLSAKFQRPCLRSYRGSTVLRRS